MENQIKNLNNTHNSSKDEMMKYSLNFNELKKKTIYVYTFNYTPYVNFSEGYINMAKNMKISHQLTPGY